MTVVRPAEAGDRATARAILAEAHAHYFGAALPGAAVERLLADVFDDRFCRMLLALEDGRAVGFATHTLLQPSTNGLGTLFLKDLYVAEARRGGGLGRRLLGALARIAAERGCSRFDWTTEADNPRAVALYERLGAARVAEKVYYRVRAEDMAAFIAVCEG